MNFKNSYIKLDARLYHRQPPTPLTNPRAGHFNPIVAQQIGWDVDDVLMDNWVDIVSGKQVPEGFEPLAMAYAGHQFGQWAGQLGDGRGLLMAQVLDSKGQLTDLHLKGVGLTPYSRMGDGRAVLRSTIREYLCGHAMSSLGIASSNALGFVTSDTSVRREGVEQGAALMRVADSHIRLGHIEWIASFAPDLLESFTYYMIDTYYPQLRDSANPVLDFIEQVVKRTAIMIANWQLVGFAHGVMNTDNLSITGSTIDYGPFGFLERFNPAWINNHSDHAGRYTYQNQPAIGHWNLSIWAMNFMRLATATHNNTDSNAESINKENISQRLAHYERTFMTHYQQGICQKLGLPWQNVGEQSNNQQSNHESNNEPKNDTANYKESNANNALNYNADTINTTLKLAFELLEVIEGNKLDYTNSFRSLVAMIDASSYPHETHLLHTLRSELNPEALQRFDNWQADYLMHIESQISSGQLADKSEAIKTLMSTNPVYVLRNAMAQKAIEHAQSGEMQEVDRVFTLLATPYKVQDIAILDDILPPSKDDAPIVISCSS